MEKNTSKLGWNTYLLMRWEARKLTHVWQVAKSANCSRTWPNICMTSWLNDLIRHRPDIFRVYVNSINSMILQGSRRSTSFYVSYLRKTMGHHRMIPCMSSICLSSIASYCRSRLWPAYPDMATLWANCLASTPLHTLWHKQKTQWSIQEMNNIIVYHPQRYEYTTYDYFSNAKYQHSAVVMRYFWKKCSSFLETADH